MDPSRLKPARRSMHAHGDVQSAVASSDAARDTVRCRSLCPCPVLLPCGAAQGSCRAKRQMEEVEEFQKHMKRTPSLVIKDSRTRAAMPLCSCLHACMQNLTNTVSFLPPHTPDCQN